jgi:hypothetical protein
VACRRWLRRSSFPVGLTDGVILGGKNWGERVHWLYERGILVSKAAGGGRGGYEWALKSAYLVGGGAQ